MNKKQTYLDEAAFAEFFQTLLNQLSIQLDQYYGLGLPVILSESPIFRLYFEQIKEMEEELLIGWKIMEQQGSEAVLDYQKKWYYHQIRQEDSLFSSWSLLALELKNHHSSPELQLAKNPWASFVLGFMTDKEAMSPFINEADPKSTKLTQVMEFLLALFAIDPEHQFTSFLNFFEVGSKKRPDPTALGRFQPQASQQIFQTLTAGPTTQEAVAQLQSYWEKNSGGATSLFSAFAVRNNKNQIHLEPLTQVREVAFGQLFGISEQQKKLSQNIELFLSGKASHNCLLWGAKGMGKSSSVLALLNQYKTQGLRLIELEPRQLKSLGALFQKLKGLPEKFVIYLDDLSFEADSKSFNFLKSKLQGSLGEQASNVILVATANRKDLIFQKPLNLTYPSERQRMEEERALDDRFALKIYYPPAKFKKLEELFCFYADQLLKDYDFDSLYKEFLNFAQFNDHDQPSARSVAQFFATL